MLFRSEEVNKVRYICFLRVSEFLEKLVKPEKSQTYLVCSRINFRYSRFEVIGIGDIDDILDEQELNKTTGTATK